MRPHPHQGSSNIRLGSAETSHNSLASKNTGMQSALSLHLNSLVQRTTKNLNTGIYTGDPSPMRQAGIGHQPAYA